MLGGKKEKENKNKTFFASDFKLIFLSLSRCIQANSIKSEKYQRQDAK